MAWKNNHDREKRIVREGWKDTHQRNLKSQSQLNKYISHEMCVIMRKKLVFIYTTASLLYFPVAMKQSVCTLRNTFGACSRLYCSSEKVLSYSVLQADPILF